MNKYGKTLTLVGCSAQLPNNFNALEQSHIDDLVSGSVEYANCIVAAGLNVDASVTFVTLIGEVIVFDPQDNCIPPGDYLPTTMGDKIFLPNDGTRWPQEVPGFLIESKWVLERSRSALDDTSLSIGDSYHNEADTATEVDDT